MRVARYSQIAVSSAALVVWVYALGGIFATFGFYAPWQGTALIILSSAFLAFFEPPGAAASGGRLSHELLIIRSDEGESVAA